MDRWLKEYKAKFKGSTAIPMKEVMGNQVLREQFDDNPELVYMYCVEYDKTWEEVIGYEFDPNVV